MAISKCVSLSNGNRLAGDEAGFGIRIDENGCHGTPDFPVAVYLDNVTTDCVNWHCHDEIEIGFVTEGAVIIGCGTRKYTLACGDVFFVNSGVLHSMRNAAPPQGSVFKSIVFSGSVVGGEQNSVFWRKYLKPILYAANLKDFVLPVSSEYHANVLSLLDIWDTVDREPMHYEMLVRNGLSSLFCILLRIQEQAIGEAAQSTYGIRVENRMHLLLDYVHAHYSERISLEDLARTAAISKTEVMRCFKSIIGKSPVRYLKEYRLRQAAYLLAHTERSVEQVCESCGFEDSSYFAKSFRAQYRMTPTEYRRRGSDN